MICIMRSNPSGVNQCNLRPSPEPGGLCSEVAAPLSVFPWESMGHRGHVQKKKCADRSQWLLVAVFRLLLAKFGDPR